MHLPQRKRARGPSAFAPAVGVKGASPASASSEPQTPVKPSPKPPSSKSQSLPFKSAALHLLSGGLSAGLVRASLQPLDTYGVPGLYRGVIPGIVGIVPAAAIYMLTFQTLKKSLSRRFPARARDVVVASSAALGDVAASLVRVPCEVLKQRLQVGIYPNVAHALRASFSAPLPKMYSGLSAQLARDVPYAAVEFVVYENLKERFKSDGRMVKRARSHSLIVGGVSGAIAAVISNPLDVVKTRLMTQTSTSAVRYRGVAHALTTVASQEGLSAFAKGIAPRIAAKTLQSALFFAAYEQVKATLGQMLGVGPKVATDSGL